MSFNVSIFQMAVVPEGAERHPVNPEVASYPQRSFPDSTPLGPVLPHWGNLFFPNSQSSQDSWDPKSYTGKLREPPASPIALESFGGAVIILILS